MDYISEIRTTKLVEYLQIFMEQKNFVICLKHWTNYFILLYCINLEGYCYAE